MNALRREDRRGSLRRVIDRLLRAGLERQEALGESAHRVADRLTKAGVAESAANPATHGASNRAKRVADKALRRKHRRGLERQEALRELPHRVADGLTSALIAEAAANPAAHRPADRAQRIADKALRRKRRPSFERQHIRPSLRTPVIDDADRRARPRRVAEQLCGANAGAASNGRKRWAGRQPRRRSSGQGRVAEATADEPPSGAPIAPSASPTKPCGAKPCGMNTGAAVCGI